MASEREGKRVGGSKGFSAFVFLILLLLENLFHELYMFIESTEYVVFKMGSSYYSYSTILLSSFKGEGGGGKGIVEIFRYHVRQHLILFFA